MESNDFWGIIYEENTAKYKELLLVVELILGMVFTTSCVERVDLVLSDALSLIGNHI